VGEGGRSFNKQKKKKLGGGREKIKFQEKIKLGRGQGENKVAKRN
jgi:hypothetical protein